MLADREEPTPHLGLKHGGPINQFCRILTSSIIDLVRMRLSANPRELAGGVSNRLLAGNSSLASSDRRARDRLSEREAASPVIVDVGASVPG